MTALVRLAWADIVLLWVHAERGDDPAGELVLERAAADEGRGGEGQAALAAAHRDQACAALLHDAAGVLRCAAMVQPRACGPQRGVPGDIGVAAPRRPASGEVPGEPVIQSARVLKAGDEAGEEVAELGGKERQRRDEG